MHTGSPSVRFEDLKSRTRCEHNTCSHISNSKNSWLVLVVSLKQCAILSPASACGVSVFTWVRLHRKATEIHQPQEQSSILRPASACGVSDFTWVRLQGKATPVTRAVCYTQACQCMWCFSVYLGTAIQFCCCCCWWWWWWWWWFFFLEIHHSQEQHFPVIPVYAVFQCVHG